MVRSEIGERAMASRPALITGFEPYGGRGVNPASEIVRALDGLPVGQARVIGRTLPVAYAGLHELIAGLIQEISPAVMLGIGLWPGEPVIRLERFAVNLADFEIADNAGERLTDQALQVEGPAALASTIPLRRIEAAMLAQGIPVRLSTTAGSFLCNACLFAALSTAAAAACSPLCGFIHVPYLPHQVAAILKQSRHDATLELHQRADLASMELSTMICAVRIAAEIAAADAA